jgi:hypothetical protein
MNALRGSSLVRQVENSVMLTESSVNFVF